MKKRISGMMTFFGVMVLVLLIAQPVSAQTITDLGTLPGGSYSRAYGINDQGQIVGGSFFVNDSGTIAGTVTNATSGAAISGATVTVGPFTRTTDASGAYSMGLFPGTYTVTASATGYNTDSASVTLISFGKVTQDFALTPATYGTIAGTVTNATSGAAISGATVTAGGITTTTDDSGTYSIIIAPGTYTVEASATGYNTDSASVTVISGGTVPQHFPLTPATPGTITGMVTDATSGAAISGAIVTAGGITTTTDASGTYGIIIAPGTYTVEASATGYNTVSASLTVISGWTVIQYFHLTPAPGTIAGTVTDVNSAAPISGATVTAGLKTTTTDTSGNYIITIDPGPYTVTASATGYNTDSASVIVTSGGTVTQDFHLTPAPGTIAGTVTDVNSAAPISGATIKAGLKTTTTDTSGNYIITIDPGPYTVIASATGYNTASSSVTVTSGGTVTRDFALIPVGGGIILGTIKGTVTNATSLAPISGATVTAGGITRTTDANGNYIISIGPGTYTVKASATGYNSASASVIVTSGGTVTRDFALTPGFTATKDFRLTNVDFASSPAQLGALLPQNGGDYNVSYVLNRKGMVSGTSPKEVYGMITVNGTGVADVIVNDTFSAASGSTQFIVSPAKLVGGVEIIRYNTTTGVATVLTRTKQITSASVNNAAHTVNLTIRLNTPLASDEDLMVYVKFATALKGMSPNYADFVNTANVTTNQGTPETATATINFV
jgi:uncharacterized membrane protein